MDINRQQAHELLVQWVESESLRRHMYAVEAKSVKKKLKDKSIAAKVSREDMALGLGEMDLSDEEHIDFVIAALRPVAK